MYLRLYQFGINANQRSTIETMAANTLNVIRAQNGCDRCEFFIDPAGENCGFLVQWTSMQAVDAAAPVIFPVLTPLLALANAAPQIRFYEIYEPKK
jgi:hypothetical protein